MRLRHCTAVSFAMDTGRRIRFPFRRCWIRLRLWCFRFWSLLLCFPFLDLPLTGILTRFLALLATRDRLMISSAVISLIQINKLTSFPNLFPEGINAVDLLTRERVPCRCLHTSAVFLPDIAFQMAHEAIMSTLAARTYN